MPGNLLPYITARFNIGALHVFKVGRMMLRNDRRRFRWNVIESLWFEVGTFRSERASSERDLGIVIDGSVIK